MSELEQRKKQMEQELAAVAIFQLVVIGCTVKYIAEERGVSMSRIGAMVHHGASVVLHQKYGPPPVFPGMGQTTNNDQSNWPQTIAQYRRDREALIPRIFVVVKTLSAEIAALTSKGTSSIKETSSVDSAASATLLRAINLDDVVDSNVEGMFQQFLTKLKEAGYEIVKPHPLGPTRDNPFSCTPPPVKKRIKNNPA